jgi:CBS domain-containing protein
MNAIANRIADFLKEHQPFSNLTFDELAEIASSIRVLNLEKNKILFQINDSLHDCFYVVASGVVNLSVVSDAEETLLNKCVEGEIFGLRPFFAKNKYKMTSKAREEAIIYAIPIEVFKPFVARNNEVLDFLLESFANNSNDPNDRNTKNRLLSDNAYLGGSSNESQLFQSLSYNKSPLTTSANVSVREAALLMTESNSDAILIIDKELPIGIVTDSDLRSKVATGRFPSTATIDKIMASPVISVTENVSLAEAQLILLQFNVSHLCVTLDGNDKSPVKGIISEHDLIVAQASNPGVLLKEIKRAEEPKDLRKIRLKLGELIQSSIDKNIPLSHTLNLSGEINSAITKRAVEQAIVELGSPPARYAWFSIGSQGRKEQLLMTDQDSILIFEDVSEDKYRDVKDYFIRLAKKTVSILEKVGYASCSNGHVASNILWCKSLIDWLKQYDNWMNTPGENTNDISSIFFDYELIIGEAKIEEAISNLISKNSKNNSLFFDYLGNDTIKKPSPLGFFKKFNTEEDGIYKDLFDIKTRALMPLIDGARLFTLNNNIKGINNTYLRFKQLAITDSKHSEIYLNCAEAFLVLSKFRTLEGLKNDSDGSYINVESLSKVDKEKLKNALNPMKELEDLIKDTFQLTQFS